MDQETLRNVQINQLQILLEFDRICKKNNIQYFLIAGTAIGAVRHKGFIPWDEDIDIGILRKDYDKFLNVCESEINSEYFLQTFETDFFYPTLYAKIRRNGTTFIEAESNHLGKKMHQGIFIDIFPIDNISDNSFFAKMHFALMHFFISISSARGGNYPNTKIKRLIKKAYSKPILKFFRKETIDRWSVKTASLLKEKKTKNVINFFGRYRMKEKVPFEYYGNGVYMEFEERKFPFPEKWDDFLKQIYGDYMEIPDVDNRGIHNIIHVNLDESYESYFDHEENKI